MTDEKISQFLFGDPEKYVVIWTDKWGSVRVSYVVASDVDQAEDLVKECEDTSDAIAFSKWGLASMIDELDRRDINKPDKDWDYYSSMVDPYFGAEDTED